MVNGNLSLYKIFIGAGISATLGILTFMGNGIVHNEQRNVDDHKSIRHEITVEVGHIKDIVTDVRIEQTQQRVILDRIEKKL